MDKFFDSVKYYLSALKTPGRLRLSIFRSARLKLTLFYLAIILFFCLALSISVRILAGHEYQHAGAAQRGAIDRLFLGLYSVPPFTDRDFYRIQNDQDAIARQHLNEDLIIANVIAFAVGGVLSYWYAGRTLEPIEEAHRAQSRFAADASHELRTPLAALRLENEVFLRQRKPKLDEATEVIRSNLEEVSRLESLAANLLAITQYEGASLELKRTNAGHIIAQAAENIAKAAKEKQIKITQSAEPGYVIGHSDSLVQLTGILLDNAVKYGPAASSVHLSGKKADGRYFILVRDEGPGIAEDDLPYIFERLYRGDKARSSQVAGYGLGLSVAREIARANHAKLSAHNVLSGGAEFVLELPQAK